MIDAHRPLGYLVYVPLGQNEIQQLVGNAVKRFWSKRAAQALSQRARGNRDQGARGAVTGGAQMNGFVDLIAKLVKSAGLASTSVYTRQSLELPGFFRPTKKWDILVVSGSSLVAVIETKSQVGSLGNNFNNRTEEAIGSAVDLWTAFREGAFRKSGRPWLGYLFLLEDSPKSQSPVGVQEPHFAVFEEFRGASYAKRYELLLRKLIRERHYEAAAFLVSDKLSGRKGLYKEPADDLTFVSFARSLIAHVAGYVVLPAGDS